MSTRSILPVCLIVLLLGLSQCKPKVEETEQEEIQLTIPEKIAHAHGYENWKNVEEIAFAFNFKSPRGTFKRSWTWQTKANTVQMQMDTLIINYDRSQELDSLAMRYDRGFINDRYWILLPFNLMWDKASYTYETTENRVAPISADTLDCLTIVYKSEGGYTPGDAYDIFYDEDYTIREWIFRRGNGEEPNSIATWENYKEVGGLKLVSDHNYPNGNHLFITGLEVKTKQD